MAPILNDEKLNDKITPIIHLYDKTGLSDRILDSMNAEFKRAYESYTNYGFQVSLGPLDALQQPELLNNNFDEFRKKTKIQIAFPFHGYIGSLILVGDLNLFLYGGNSYYNLIISNIEIPLGITDPKEQLKYFVQQITQPAAFEQVWKDIEAELDAQSSKQSIPTSVDNS